jgi:hypothetical protein
MIAILVVTAVLVVASLALIRCSDRGKAGPAERPWSAAVPSSRKVPLDDLVEQATGRARRVIPDAVLSRITVRPIDAAGMVHLDAGSASFEFVAASGAAAAPCTVQFVMSWQGWTQRIGGSCEDPPVAPRCRIVDVFARALPGAPEGALASVLLEGAPPRWTLRRVDAEAGGHVAIVDDCG